MSDHVLSQVEDQLATTLGNYTSLAGWTIMVAESLDVAIEGADLPLMLITTVAYGFDVADENWMTLHSAEIHVEAVSKTQSSGTISRANRNGLAHVLAAVAADRTLGVGLQDIQEDDIAPVEPRGKDVDSASLKFRVQWFTARGDWFAITT